MQLNLDHISRGVLLQMIPQAIQLCAWLTSPTGQMLTISIYYTLAKIFNSKPEIFSWPDNMKLQPGITYHYGLCIFILHHIGKDELIKTYRKVYVQK